MDRGGWSYPAGDLRVSDADRDRALSELTEAFQVGRLTADEFDQRSGQALGARTGQELTALLADLPPDRAPATPTAPAPEEHASDLDRAHRILVMRTVFAASVAAICCAAVAVANGLSDGPSLQQRELAQQIMAHQGLSMPIPPAPGFDWVGTMTPAAIAVLLVMLVVYLRVRVARGDRP
jgi:Domain of unknown function (DUF1707)